MMPNEHLLFDSLRLGALFPRPCATAPLMPSAEETVAAAASWATFYVPPLRQIQVY